MLASTAVLALAVSPAIGAYVGFNYGSTFTTGAVKVQSDYEAEFKAAQALVSAPTTFSSARLYTMIQGGTANSVIQAIPAAISTKTSLLLGLWASAGDANFANEIAALKSAIATYGSSIGSGLDIAGISVGSEDLYRISPTGIANGENPGAEPDTIVNYIGQVKAAIANTAFANIPVGHVDTWTAWVNGSNAAVSGASDFIGIDAYPYFEDTVSNAIGSGQSLFNSAFDATKAAVGGKPVWITETGWPVSGPTRNLAVASVDNAKTYWDEVGCSNFGVTNTWWFTLQDASPATPSPSFGIVGSTLTGPPLYDLSCNASTPSESSSSVTTVASSTATTVASSAASGSSTAEVVVPGTSVSGSEPTASGSGSSASGIATASGTGASPSASSGSGSGSGSTTPVSGTSGSGPVSSGSGTGSNATYTSSVPGPSSSVVLTNNGATNAVSTAAAFAALFAASLLL